MDDPTLLTAEDEVTLARAVEAGLLARLAGENGDYTLAGPAELRALQLIGEAAQRRMVAANVRLVQTVVSRAAWAAEVPAADLFQDGCIGLIEAVQRFDHARGHRFATYALIRIRAAVSTSIRVSRAGVEGTAHRQRQQDRLRREESRLSQRFGRPATATEVAAALERDPGWVRDLLRHETTVEVESVQLSDEVTPFTAGPTGGSEETSVALLDRLTPTHRRVVELRFGFDGSPRSLREVADAIGTSLGRVRRFEREALEDLRRRCPYEARALM